MGSLDADYRNSMIHELEKLKVEMDDWNKSHDGKYEFVAESLEKAIGILKTVDGQKFEYGFS
ncbi:MAG: hypothetical protein CMJ46_12495 [Planctomyces sp.]|nr:hypothetical protein [Planctomyces sp.]